MFLDSDDIFTEDACKLLYEEITNEDIDIVSGVHTIDGENVHPALWLDTITDPDKSYAKRMEKVNEIVNDSNFTFKINSLDDCPAISANFGVWTKIFKKSLIENNNIRFPEGIPAEDSTFLWNAFLNANGIKFINKFIVVYTTDNYSSISHQISKKTMFGKLNGYYQMYFLAEEKNKVDIFAHYLLLSKLYYLVKDYLLNAEWTTSELLEVFEYSHDLFKVVVENNDKINIETAPLFKFIAKQDYESTLKYIFKFNKFENRDL